MKRVVCYECKGWSPLFPMWSGVCHICKGRTYILVNINGSRYRGVGWDAHMNKWHAFINFEGHTLHLGFFDNEDEAAHLYNKTALSHHVELAKLNNIED